MNNILSVLFVTIMFVSCNCKGIVETEGNSCDTIIVTYTPYLYDTSISIPCSRIAEDERCDSIGLTVKEISTNDFDIIADFIKHVKPTGQEGWCDARVHVKMGDYELCFGDFVCCSLDVDDNILNTSDFEYAIYKIKHLSGYYNCYDTLDIKYDELVCKFGIPEDYFYDSKPFFIVLDTDEEGEIYDYNVEDVRRVALVRKSNLISGDAK